MFVTTAILSAVSVVSIVTGGIAADAVANVVFADTAKKRMRMYKREEKRHDRKAAKAAKKEEK